MGSGLTRTAALGGKVIRCTSDLGDCLAAFEHSVAYLLSSEKADLEFEIREDSSGFYWVSCDGSSSSQTSYRCNVMALLQAEVEYQMEHHYPGWLRIHAGAVWHERCGGLLLVGASGSGKSTGVLHLCRAGWQLIADDMVLLDPKTLTILGLSWAIRLRLRAEGLVFLRREGLSVWPEEWRGDDEVHSSALVKPVSARSWEPLLPRHLGAIIFLSRGEPSIEPLTAGGTILRLWPQRVARCDGVEPWSMGELANALARVRSAELRTSSPEEVVELVTEWS